MCFSLGVLHIHRYAHGRVVTLVSAIRNSKQYQKLNYNQIDGQTDSPCRRHVTSALIYKQFSLISAFHL